MLFILTASRNIKIHKARFEASCSRKVCTLKFVLKNQMSFILFIPTNLELIIFD